MPIDFNLRRGLHPKRWENFGSYSVGATFQGGVGSHPDHPWSEILITSPALLYSMTTGGFTPLPAPGLGAGLGNTATTCCWHPNGPTGTTSAGTSDTITTNLTPLRALDGITIRLTGGTGAGQERVIASNTFGANSVITVTQPWTITPDATTTWLLRSGRYYVIAAGNPGLFKYFDPVLWAWSASLNNSTLAGWSGVDTAMTTTARAPFTSVTAVTSATPTTLTTSGKTWAIGQWVNHQVRIVGGTGAGQVRVITASTASQLTVATWTITPDNTSTYVIEGNEDAVYLQGGTALFRYTPSTDSWTTLAAGPAAMTASLHHIDMETDPTWVDESNYLNGRYLYVFRGANTADLHRYDLTTNTWAQVTYSPAATTFYLGMCTAYYAGTIYVLRQADVSGMALFKFSPATRVLAPWTTVPVFAAAGSQQRIMPYVLTRNGVTRKFLYYWTRVTGLPYVLRMQETV